MIVKYQALNHSGVLVADTLILDEASEAYAELTRRGLTPVRIEQGKNIGGDSSSGLRSYLLQRLRARRQPNPGRASRRQLPFFTAQLAILLETGTPVAASLTAIESQTACPHWALLVSQLRQHVEEGGTLASAVALHRSVFDPIYVSMISAGEASGNLANILRRLAAVARQADRIRSKIISAMIYPALLTTIATAVMAILIFFVLPRFGELFEEMNVTLPGSTKTLLALSDLVREHTFLAVAGVGAFAIPLIYLLRSSRGRRFTARNTLKLPIAGPLIVAIINARIFRLLGLLVESSVPLLQALELTACATKHYLYAELIGKIHDNVLNGKPMHEVMLQSNLVPASIARMVQTGEENGQVGKVMTMLADYLDDRNETKVGTLTSIMEPVILIFMGLIIGTVAISLVLPMFDLSRIGS